MSVELRALIPQARALAGQKQHALDALHAACQAEILLSRQVVDAAMDAAAAAGTDPKVAMNQIRTVRESLAGQDAALLHALREALAGHRIGSLIHITVNNECSITDAAERGIAAVEQQLRAWENPHA